MHARSLQFLSWVFVASVLCGESAGVAKEEPDFVRITPAEVRWRNIPDGHGAQQTILLGDPEKPGIYVADQGNSASLWLLSWLGDNNPVVRERRLLEAVPYQVNWAFTFVDPIYSYWCHFRCFSIPKEWANLLGRTGFVVNHTWSNA
jgi:hypothetical protein